jgi:hypothetical protein
MHQHEVNDANGGPMGKTQRVTPLRNMTEVVQCVNATGSRFFDRDAMRFFNSKLSDEVYPTKFGTFFVTSERDKRLYGTGAWGGKRRYTVRFVAARPVLTRRRGHTYTQKRGELIDVMNDDFGAFTTLDSARHYARKEQARLSVILIKDRPVLFDLQEDATVTQVITS